MIYTLIKAVHIIFVIAWMAGMLVYPRYKIHQMEAEPGGELAAAMQDASNRLRRIILTPSLLLVWALAITMLAMNPALFSQGWMHAKFALVIGLTGVHGYLVSLGKAIDAGAPKLSARRMRMLNEAPFLIMIGVVLLAVLKPQF